MINPDEAEIVANLDRAEESLQAARVLQTGVYCDFNCGMLRPYRRQSWLIVMAICENGQVLDVRANHQDDLLRDL